MWIDVEQNGDEWEQLRVGRVGGSELHIVMANFGKAFGEPAHKLALRVALEQITGQKQESGYSNEHMERGHLQEPIARMKYEDLYFCEVSNGGYYMHGEDIGLSPDGHVYDDGLVEIKSVIGATQYATKERGKYDPKYRWQLAQELKVSGREWIDFVSYCSEFPEEKQLIVYRVTKLEMADEFEMIDQRIDEFRKLVLIKKSVVMA